jgi:hypothetical protein
LDTTVHTRGRLRWPSQTRRIYHRPRANNKQDRRRLSGTLRSMSRLVSTQAGQSSRSQAGNRPDQSSRSPARHQLGDLDRYHNTPPSSSPSELARGRLLSTLQVMPAMMSLLRLHEARSHPTDGPMCPHRLGVSTGHHMDRFSKFSTRRVTLGHHTTHISPCRGHSLLTLCPSKDSQLTARRIR